MTEPRHDTHKMSTDEIRAAIEGMAHDSTAPPPPVANAILDAQYPSAVTCPDCGSIFVPRAEPADDPTTLDDREEPTRPT